MPESTHDTRLSHSKLPLAVPQTPLTLTSKGCAKRATPCKGCTRCKIKGERHE